MKERRDRRNSPDLADLDRLLKTVQRCGERITCDRLLELAGVVSDARSWARETIDQVDGLEFERNLHNMVLSWPEYTNLNGLTESRDHSIDGFEQLKEWFGADPPNFNLVDYCNANIARLRSIPHRDLRDAELAMQKFVLVEESPFFHTGTYGSGLDIVYLFTRWLQITSFRCGNCALSYVTLRSEPKGRPRRFCSEACKQSASRLRRSL